MLKVPSSLTCATRQPPSEIGGYGHDERMSHRQRGAQGTWWSVRQVITFEIVALRVRPFADRCTPAPSPHGSSGSRASTEAATGRFAASALALKREPVLGVEGVPPPEPDRTKRLAGALPASFESPPSAFESCFSVSGERGRGRFGRGVGACAQWGGASVICDWRKVRGRQNSAPQQCLATTWYLWRERIPIPRSKLCPISPRPWRLLMHGQQEDSGEHE